MTTGLQGKVAFITGAAHGQGRAAALALAQAGCQVVAVDVARPLAYPGYVTGTRAELDTLVEDLKRIGASGLAVAADVRDDAAVTRAVSAAMERFPGLFSSAFSIVVSRLHERVPSR